MSAGLGYLGGILRKEWSAMTHNNVTDIVERLRTFAPNVTKPNVAAIMNDAATELATLRKQLEKFESARRSWQG